ncbi:hypothetical protein [Nocardioides humi]|uniref:Uncharacterized protein n=1 Tax=Nocardioides humi TaxID=449461 RepID=A0ABN2A9Q8_9ACTN|nr:hypothetical protein [Nocardioides humi]
MTWNETHERIRILRVVEAVAAVDMSGALPWREEWRAYFDGPTGLVAALRAHWHRRSQAQADAEIIELDDLQDDHDAHDAHDAHGHRRRTEAGVLQILRRYDAGGSAAPVLLSLAGPRPSLPARTRRSRRSARVHGRVLPD